MIENLTEKEYQEYINAHHNTALIYLLKNQIGLNAFQIWLILSLIDKKGRNKCQNIDSS